MLSLHNLTKGYMNIGGLHDNVMGCKLSNDLMNNDIEILSETCGNCAHYENVEGYTLLSKNEPQKVPGINKGRKSGGILIYCKNYLVKKIKKLKQTNHYVWLEISIDSIKTKKSKKSKIKLCIIYNPPTTSRYHDAAFLENIANDIIYSNGETSYLIIGGLNARTGELMDFNETNEKDKFDNFIISENPRIKRRNCDEILNCEGIKLIYRIMQIPRPNYIKWENLWRSTGLISTYTFQQQQRCFHS